MKFNPPPLNERFASAVKASYARMRFKSLRDASEKTGVDHSSIGKMLRGEIPGAGTIVRWAVAVNEDHNELLKVAGHKEIDTVSGLVHRRKREDKSSEVRIFPVPEAVQQAIQEAPDKESKIEIAWEYIRRPEFGLKMGAYKIHEVDDRAKVIIIRMLENLQGGELLPPEIA